jgi:hypothetical protein
MHRSIINKAMESPFDIYLYFETDKFCLTLVELVNEETICSFSHLRDSAIEDILYGLPSMGAPSIHINIKLTTTHIRSRVTVVDMITRRLYHVEIKIIIVEPCQATAYITRNIAASPLYPLLDRISKVSVVGPAESILPFEQTTRSRISRSYQAYKITG